MCLRSEPCGSVVVSYWTNESKGTELGSFGLSRLVGGSAPPFIDEGDGFISERVRVRMLSSLVAHVGGYKIMVGAHNTVDVTVKCQMHAEGRATFFRDGRRRYLQILFDA